MRGPLQQNSETAWYNQPCSLFMCAIARLSKIHFFLFGGGSPRGENAPLCVFFLLLRLLLLEMTVGAHSLLVVFSTPLPPWQDFDDRF